MSLDNTDAGLLNSENAGVAWHKSETFIFEDASSVATAQVDNYSLKMPTYLDMPLLDGVSLDFAYDASNNNNTYVPFHVNNESVDQKTALNVENETGNMFVFEVPIETQNTYNHQSICNYTTYEPKYMDTELACLPIDYTSCHSEESAVNFCNPVSSDSEVISEFLVFHDRSESNDPKLEQLLECRPNTRLEPQWDPQLKPQSDPQLEPQLDPQVNLNCFVKLNNIEVTSALKEKHARCSERLRNTSVENAIPKNIKRNQPRRKKSGIAVEPSACPPKRPNTRNSKSLWDDATASYTEGPQIRMKLVRQNNSKNYECILLSDISGLDVHKSQLKTKRCSVVLEPLPSSNMCQPDSNKAKSLKADYLKAETPKASYSGATSSKPVPLKASSNESASSKVESTNARYARTGSSKAVGAKAWSSETASDKAESSNGSSSEEESFKGEFPKLAIDITTSTNPEIGQENKTTVTPTMNCNTDDEDNEFAAVTPSHVFQKCIEDIPLDLTIAKNKSTLSLVIKEQRTALLDDVNQSNEMSNCLTPVDNVLPEEMMTNANEIQPCRALNNCVEKRNHLLSSEVVAQNEVQLNKSIDKTSILDSNDKMLNVTCMDSTPYAAATTERSNFGNSPRSSDDEDDNFSISSELSIFAPSLSDLDSPKRDRMLETAKPVRNENGETKTKVYRIPKLKKTLENIKDIKQSTIDFNGLDSSDELNVTHILKQMKETMPRMLSPIKDLDFSNSEESKPKKNIHKETVPSPKNIRSLRLLAKKKTVDNEQLNKNSKSNIGNSHDKKRNTRSNTIVGAIDKKSRKKIYEDSRGFSDAIDAANSNAKNNKRKARRNTTEGPPEKKTINSIEKTPEPRRELKSSVDADTKRKACNTNGPTEKKSNNSVDKMVEPRRELKSNVDAATCNTNEIPATGSKCRKGPTEKKIINSIEKIPEPSRQFNDAADVSVKGETSKDINRKETSQSSDLRSEVQSIINTKKYDKIVIKVSNNEKRRSVSIADQNALSANVSPQTAQLFPHPTHSLPNQPNHLLPNQPLPTTSGQMMPNLPPIQRPNQLLNRPVPLMSLHTMPIIPPIPKSPNQEVLDQTIQNLGGSFTLKGWINLETRKRYSSQVFAIFNQPCINYLAKNPCPTPCTFSHVLPHANIILKTLQNFSDDLVQFIYSDFIVKHCLTFEQYFPLICQLYGTRKLEAKLTSVIEDCEKHGKYEYFGFIFSGLLLCGVNNRDALLIIFDRCNNICSASDEAILKIIESDPQSFIQIFSRAPRLTSLLTPAIVSKLMIQLSNNPTNPSQLSQCVDLLEKIGDKLVNIDQEVLRLFCNPIFGLQDNGILSTKLLKILSAVMTNN